MGKNPVLAIIGGGASGLVGGIFAKRILRDEGEVIIIERMDRIGKKILATGNGRCNFTNINMSAADFYGENPDFTRYALDDFGVSATLDFFEKLGIYPKEEENGKMYPYSGQASSVLDVLRYELQRLGVKIVTDFDVKSVKRIKSGFKIISLLGKLINADKVIVASGGQASPNLGSNGSGFDIMSDLGHRFTKVDPALVQLKTEKAIVKGLKGIKFMGNVKMFSEGRFIGEEYGEVLFTDYGLSGPPVFRLSALCAVHKKCSVLLDFMPSLSKKDVFDLLSKRKKNLYHLTMESFFTGLFNKRIGNAVAKKSGIEKLSFPVSRLNKEIIWGISENIKEFHFDIIGHNGFNNAQVTAGGVCTGEFNDKTMESLKVKGLYACGEVLDIFGNCGGFNLQWAWSSGRLAGKSAAESLMTR